MISINSVTFNYRKNSKSILNNINLEIKDKEIFRQLLDKYYWKPTPVINANPRYK